MNTTNTNIILSIQEGEIFYTSTKSIPVNKINLDNPDEFISGVKWNAEVVKIDRDKGILSVKVLGEETSTLTIPDEQGILFEGVSIKKINVTSINTGLFLLSKKIKPKLISKQKQPPKIEPTKYSFKIKLVDIEFNDGFFKIKKHIVEHLKMKQDIHIHNSAIKKEFDAVKEYFSKKLGKSKVKINLEFTDFPNKEHTVKSKDLEAINESFINSFYNDYLNNRVSSSDGRTGVFPLDELLSSENDNGAKVQVYTEPIEQTFENIIANKKHYKHLRFLSQKHKKDLMRLRYTSLKAFSFFFLLEGADSFFFVWETLDTEEATYTWRLSPKNKESIKDGLLLLDETIKEIQEIGRNSYLNKEPEYFLRISHSYSDGEKGFKKWKNEVEELLIKV